MKLVETDTESPVDEAVEEEGPPTPPRPEHRRVSVSLLFTLFVLAATVTTIYLVFPERHNALVTAAIEAHRKSPSYELERPTAAELRAWGLALMDREVPWPETGPEVEVEGVTSTTVLNRRAAVVRYRAAGQPVTVLVQRPRDAVPRKHVRHQKDVTAVSWRRGTFTFIAVGSRADDSWRELLGVP